MKSHENPPQKRILEAVLTCIEEKGIHQLTTRDIAQTAGTNIAAINYYFRSKDAAVAQALSMALNHMVEDIHAYLEDHEKSFKQILSDVLFYMLDGGFRFPKITMAHLYGAVVENDIDSPGAQAIQEVLNRLNSLAVAEYPSLPEDRIRTWLTQMASVMMFAMLSPDFLQRNLPIDLSKPEARCDFINSLIEIYFCQV